MGPSPGTFALAPVPARSTTPRLPSDVRYPALLIVLLYPAGVQLLGLGR